MVVASRFRNSLVSGKQREMPILTFNRICYGYLQNDWAMVFAASVTFVYTAACLIVPNVTHTGPNP
jgi:hypothetical protein